MDEDSLIAAEHARRAAMMRDDADALDKLLADPFHYAHINGWIDDRHAYLDRIRTGKVHCSHTAAHDLKVQMRPGYALLTGVSTMGFAWADGSAQGNIETLFTAVWEPHPDGWKMAAYASTPMA